MSDREARNSEVKWSLLCRKLKKLRKLKKVNYGELNILRTCEVKTDMGYNKLTDLLNSILLWMLKDNKQLILLL